MIGRTFGHYQVIEELGAGGMGVVYRARDQRLNRDVAFKVLPAELAADAERLARFEREARALAALSHPHIVTIHSVEEAEGVHFLTMELVEGETLDRRIPPGGMSLERFLDVAIPLAEALAAAHDRGVLHRDLKPANVMVTEDGRVKVLDFGLAKLAVAPAGEQMETLEKLTREERIVGTPPYMSPEQLHGSPLDARSDLFSLGVVFYEMATGRRPFSGASAAELLSSILRDEPAPVSELRPELPRQLGRILRHCLAKEPARRFQTAQDVRNDLEALREEISETRVVEKLEEQRRSRAPLDQAVKPATAVPARLTWRRLGLPALLVIPLIVAGLLWLRPSSAPAPDTPSVTEAAFARTALAVLPFQNLSADPEHAYFAGGLHDELLTQLSRVAALSPRGRTSVMGYAETTKPLSQIAAELQVGALVEGSVQVVAGRLRVGVRLLDTASGEPLWAERYDRPLDDAFAIQSDVAQRIVVAVGAALASDERRAMIEAPTANAQAYQLYLQGLEYSRRPTFRRQNWEIAQQLFERSIELDPEFALAYAALAEVHGKMHWIRYDTSHDRVVAHREAAEAALRLAPELPQARMAMGLWHYFGRRNWTAALKEFDAASLGLPNDAWLVSWVGYVHRRMGNWDAAVAAFEQAAELDPRDATLFHDLGGGTYRALRRYPEALAAFDRALVLAPDLHVAAMHRAWTLVQWKGDLTPLRAALEGIPADAALSAAPWPSDRAELLLLERDTDGLIDYLESLRPEILESPTAYWPRTLYAAWAHRLKGNTTEARRAFERARELLDSVPAELEEDYRVRTARGLALAGLGRREEALAEAGWLEGSVVYRNDAWEGLALRLYRAWILAESGEADAALDEAERHATGPSWITVHIFHLDPRWDPIRHHPRFQALLARYGER
jgi:serine/threonine protein kinase/TolB-like protein